MYYKSIYMKAVLIAIAIACIMVIPASAVSIHAERDIMGLGHTNVDTEISTHVQYSNGHTIIVKEHGTGIVDDTVIVKASTANETAFVHTEISKEYQPIVYNNASYDDLWSFSVAAQNYIVGGAVHSAYNNSMSINETSDWLNSNELTDVSLAASYVGERHFGIEVVDPHDVTREIMKSTEDYVGMFDENRRIIIAEDYHHTQYASDFLGCP